MRIDVCLRILEIEVSFLYGQLRDSLVYRDGEESLTGHRETRTKWYTERALKGEQDFQGTKEKKKLTSTASSNTYSMNLDNETLPFANVTYSGTCSGYSSNSL